MQLLRHKELVKQKKKKVEALLLLTILWYTKLHAEINLNASCPQVVFNYFILFFYFDARDGFVFINLFCFLFIFYFYFFFVL